MRATWSIEINALNVLQPRVRNAMSQTPSRLPVIQLVSLCICQPLQIRIRHIPQPLIHLPPHTQLRKSVSQRAILKTPPAAHLFGTDDHQYRPDSHHGPKEETRGQASAGVVRRDDDV